MSFYWPPLLRTRPLVENGSIVTVCDELLRGQSASVAAPAAHMSDPPATATQPSKPSTARPSSPRSGSSASTEPMATPPQAAVRPVIAKAATVTNRDRVDEVMLNRIDVTNCDRGA